MNQAWVNKPLGEVCNVVGGGTPSKRNPAFYKGDIPWATVRDMRKAILSHTEFRISKEAVKGSSTNIIPAGNVVIATRVGLGKVCLLDQDTAINQDLRGIIPKSNNINTSFLFRWFQSIASTIEAEGTGATVKGVKLPFIKSLRLPLPPLSEQKRIVAILDEAFAGIDAAVANTETNLANASELFESYLDSLFSHGSKEWLTKPLGECFRLRSGDGLTKNQMRPGEFPVFGGNGIAGTHDEYNLSGSKVVIGRVGALCGNARHVNEPIWLTDNAFKVVDKKYSIDDQFLVYLLNSYNLRRYARQAAQPVISNSSLKEINLSFPETEFEQRHIVDRLDELKKEIHRVKSIYQQKLAALAELKQSLLQKAFTGELTAETPKEMEAELA